ncbi:MAG TPA: PLD nuclease N-terminal domain-containing protein [Anaerolineaceae bacterium]|jgi:hypothetical protein|nr:PLD nuclease N-terminal domain-containing protein [Anaerolineaceae bacterium]HNZ14228.1 PLD nuclease N-terminal domain-containing protein [Anaerolineaceae bacterium]HOD05205.1 PLD nuclease N-terminal domain-containing protein [Anaerolineaceae bacterium]HQF64081.1 PLD nuclease N-terminal domain-containing protein [Anaerolineaceae bacterium]HQH87098.1 PLD nuclease N-terminal domain-containing protein [Anaerolineaceae bacterium]
MDFDIQRYLPLLIPIALLQLGLMIYALVDLIRRQRTKGPKWMWALIILLINFIGPVVYLLAGREEDEA